MSKQFPADLGMRLLALVVAVALWFVAAEDTGTRPIGLEERVIPLTVRVEGVGTGLVSVSGVTRVDVRLRVPSGVAGLDQVTAHVNLTGRRAGEHQVTVNVVAPPRFTVVSVTPDHVKVRLEREVTRTFPVELAVIGVPAGTTLFTQTPEPTNVTLTGAETRINQVSRVLAVVAYDPAAVVTLASIRPIDSKGADVTDLVARPQSVKVTFGDSRESDAAEEQASGEVSQVPSSPGLSMMQSPLIPSDTSKPPTLLKPTQSGTTASTQDSLSTPKD